MVHSLLCVCLMCCNMGVGANAPTPIYDNRPQKQEQQRNYENNSQTYEHTFNLTNEDSINVVSLSQTENYTPTQSYPANYVIGLNTINETYVSAFSIKGQIRDENLMVGNDQSNYGIALPLQGYPTHETTSLWVLEIEPTAYFTENETALDLKLDGKIHNWTAPDNNVVNMSTAILVSTQETWAQYIGINDNSTYKYNYQIYSAIRNGTLGLNYNLYTNNQQFTVNSTFSSEDYTIQQDIQLNPTKKNYIVIYQEPTIVNRIGNDPYGIIEQQGNNTSATYMYANIFNGNNERRYFTLSGTYIIPPSSYEVIDLPGVMWQILTMPFSFISTAFNLTLFPGTPYQLNISNLIMTIFGVMVFLFIFKLILKR